MAEGGSSKTATVPVLRVLLVRHGETDANVQGIIQGQLDTDLNEHGRRQAHAVARALANEVIDEIYTSTLRRAVDTATAIHAANTSIQARGIPLTHEPRLMERYFGVLQGQVWKGGDRSGVEGIEPVERVTERLAAFWNDVVLSPGPWHDVPDDEAEEEPQIGSETLSNGSAAPTPSPGQPGDVVKTILLVGHGSALSTLAGTVLIDGGYVDLAPGVERGRIWNCSITEIHVPASPARASSSSSTSASRPSPSLVCYRSLGSKYLKKHASRWLVRPLHLAPSSFSSSTTTGRTPPSTFTWPDGTPLGDIGHGPGRGVIKRWADVAHIKAMAAANSSASAADVDASKLVVNVDEMVENPSAPVSGAATPALRREERPTPAQGQSQGQAESEGRGKHIQTIPIIVEFGGGTELLTSTPDKKSHSVQLPAQAEEGEGEGGEGRQARPADVRFLIKWIADHLIAERHELFVEGETVRPGILVLINDADWELEGEGDYVLRPGDRVVFISTLHGG